MNLGVPLITDCFFGINDANWPLRQAEEMNRVYFAEAKSVKMHGYKQFAIRPENRLAPDLQRRNVKIEDINLGIFYKGLLWWHDGSYLPFYLQLMNDYPYSAPNSFTCLNSHHKLSNFMDCLKVKNDEWKPEFGLAYFVDWHMGNYRLVHEANAKGIRYA